MPTNAFVDLQMWVPVNAIETACADLAYNDLCGFSLCNYRYATGGNRSNGHLMQVWESSGSCPQRMLKLGPHRLTPNRNWDHCVTARSRGGYFMADSDFRQRGE
jgi:hypothetical protein